MVLGRTLASGLALVAVSLVRVPAAHAQPPVHPFYSIDVSLDPGCDSARLRVMLAYLPEQFGDSTTFLLAADARIEKVLHLGDSLSPALWTREDGGALRVVKDDGPHSPRHDAILIQYVLPVDTLSGGDIVLRRESLWYPVWPDVPFGSRVAFKAPQRYTVLSSGTRGRTGLQDGVVSGEFVVARPILSLPLVFLNSASTIVTTSNDSGKTVRLYSRSADAITAQAIVSECLGAIRYYSTLLGPYPYDDLVVVEPSDGNFGQCQPGLLIMGKIFMEYFWQPGIGHWPAHEVAHQWIGNTILTHTLSDAPGKMFVEESLAEYLRIDFIRHSRGSDSAQAILDSFQRLISDLNGESVRHSLYNLTHSTQEDRTRAYNEGPLVWQELRSLLGEDQWSTFLRALANGYRHRLFGYDDLRRLLEAIDDTHSAAAFLDQRVGYAVAE